MKGLTQPCMHRFAPENNANCIRLQVKYEGKAQMLTPLVRVPLAQGKEVLLSGVMQSR
jgi:hypothetical protein